ncbi:hypothetical protein TNCV_2928411 [Trichonephila clavipes]|nr:hypothetical protein TNCV_2928411 [Trichonephila clavipes]
MHAHMLQKDCSRLLFRATHATSSAQPTYSLDILPIEHMWDLVGRHLARLQLQKTNFCCAYKQYGNSLHQADIQNLFSMPRYIAPLIATRWLHPNTDFRHLIFFL